MARRAFRVPRRITPGTIRADAPGATLDCLILAARNGEGFAVDLASGAFVRLSGLDETPTARPDAYPVVRVTIAPDPDPPDPARPELVRVEADAATLGTVAGRRARRLLDALVAADRPGATVLNSRGPSLAYVDLDGSTASVVLLACAKQPLELMGPPESPQAAIGFGGVTQTLPVLDPRATGALERVRPRSLTGKSLAAELGFRPGYLLVGLDTVREGHVRKVVFAVLARRGVRGGATSEASPPPDPRPSPSRS